MIIPCDFFFFNDTATTEIYTLSLHDALPISPLDGERRLISAITRAPSGPRRAAWRRLRGGGAAAAAARTAGSGSRSARRSAASRASATARARNESVEVTAAIVVLLAGRGGNRRRSRSPEADDACWLQ